MAVSRKDLAVAERQLGRPPRALAGVAARCPHGAPAVLEQRPYDDDGVPFPTTFWLSCRHLVELVGALESAGGVAALEAELAGDPGLRADRDRAEERLRVRRRELDAARPAGAPRLDGGASLASGIGGVAPGGGLKCLHAHAALALVVPYALGDRVLERAGATFPDRCCAAT